MPRLAPRVSLDGFQLYLGRRRPAPVNCASQGHIRPWQVPLPVLFVPLGNFCRKWAPGQQICVLNVPLEHIQIFRDQQIVLNAEQAQAVRSQGHIQTALVSHVLLGKHLNLALGRVASALRWNRATIGNVQVVTTGAAISAKRAVYANMKTLPIQSALRFLTHKVLFVPTTRAVAFRHQLPWKDLIPLLISKFTALLH